MNYAEMTDFEINKLVGSATGEATASEPVFNQVIRNSNGKEFNPCNSWADAGPIIKNNRIAIQPIASYWQAGSGMDKPLVPDVNPLRAAMIVFLMMQESEK